MRKKNSPIVPGASFFVAPKALSPFDKIDGLSQTVKPNLAHGLASSAGIQQVLLTISDQAHIIDSELGSIRSILSPDPTERLEASVAYAKVIAGFNINGVSHPGLVQYDGGLLTKPIIMILNTQAVKPRHQTDAKAIGGSHWVTCVILPRNYVTPKGVAIHNPREIIYYIDPLYENRKLPADFKAILQSGLMYTYVLNEIDYAEQITAPFPEAQFIDEINVFQQADGSVDCGWWALYNALQIIQTGSTDYLAYFRRQSYQNIERKTRQFAGKLRASFPQLVEAAENNQPKLKVISQPESVALQSAILESIASYQTYLARDSAIPGRRGNDYQTLILMQHALQHHFNGQQFTLKTEVDDGTDLDDLELQVNGMVYKYQIKHATKRDDYYTPAELLGVTKAKLVDPKLAKGEKARAPLVHFFESWYQCLYVNKSYPKDKVEFGLLTTCGLNGDLMGLYNKKTQTFNPEYFQVSKPPKKRTNKLQAKFVADIKARVMNLKILKGKADAYKLEKIVEFFGVFKLKLNSVYVNDLEQDIRKLLSANNMGGESIYRSLFYHFNNWVREHLPDKMAKTVTHESTNNLLLDLILSSKTLERLIGVSQARLNHVCTDIYGFSVMRPEMSAALFQALDSDKKLIFLTGEQGVGKSAFVKQFINEMKWTQATLFIKDSDDLVIDSELLQKTGGLAGVFGYFSEVKLIVIDSAEHWLREIGEKQKQIITAVIKQTRIPVLFTITSDSVKQFINAYIDKKEKVFRLTIPPLSIATVRGQLVKVARQETIEKMLGNAALLKKCQIPFWLNHIIKNFKDLNVQLDHYEEVVLERIITLVVKGSNQSLAEARYQIWLSISHKSRNNYNRAILLDDFEPAAIESLCGDRVIVKQGSAGYTLQHDIYYDLGFRALFEVKLSKSRIKESYSSIIEIINKSHKNKGIQIKIIENMKLLSAHINDKSDAIVTLIAAAIYSDEGLEHFIELLDDGDSSQLKAIQFLGVYYDDAYLLAIKSDNVDAIKILNDIQAPMHFLRKNPIVVVSSGGDSSDSSEEGSSDIDSVSNDDKGESSLSEQKPEDSADYYDAHDEWYKSPKKYDFANFRVLDSYYDYDDEIENNYEERPNYENHFQYLLAAHRNKGYLAFQTLLFRQQWLLTSTNNFGESLLHYTVLLKDNELLRDILYACRIYKVRIDSQDRLGETPLHNACYNQDNEAIKLLLADDANPNLANNVLVTPFHIAIATRNRLAIKMMINYGVDLELPSYGNMPIIALIAEVEDAVDNDDFILYLQRTIQDPVFSRSLDSLLNHSKWNGDRTDLLYCDENSEFVYLLEECGQYFDAVNVLTNITADKVEYVMDTLDEHSPNLKYAMIDHLTNYCEAWIAVGIWAFRTENGDAIEQLDFDDSIQQELLKAAVDEDETIAAINKYFDDKALGIMAASRFGK